MERPQRTARQQRHEGFHHHAVGELTLGYEGMELSAEPGFTLLVYTAEAGSPSEQGLRLLATLAATADRNALSDAGTSDAHV